MSTESVSHRTPVGSRLQEEQINQEQVGFIWFLAQYFYDENGAKLWWIDYDGMGIDAQEQELLSND